MLTERSLRLDVFALVLLAATAFTAVSLWTYSPADSPGALVYPPSDEYQNACGRSGAFVAHHLFEIFGVGAYYFVASLGALTALLLMRRSIDHPFVRIIGWSLSLIGLTTVAAMTLSDYTPGPVVGAGGYVGALCKGLLEVNFARTGAYILTTSVIVAGLLLCTDYLLLRLLAMTAMFSAKGLLTVGHISRAAAERLPKRPEPTQAESEDAAEADESEEEWEEGDGEEWEEEGDDEYEYEDGENEEEENHPPREIKVRTPQSESSQDDQEAKAANASEDGGDTKTRQAVGGVKSRIASALRLKKPKKKSEREEMIEELEAASLEGDEELDYELPPIDLLLASDNVSYDEHKREVRRKAKVLERTFANFGFRVRVVEIETGPVIAQYEVELDVGLRLSKITSLADDLAIALRVPSVRIVAPIPGKNTVGIEVPNENRQLVRLREVIEETNGRAKRMRIPIFLGKDVAGNPMVIDLAALPHLLIAGRTGTGKSVCLNSIIVSILMGRGPDEVRLLLIDPKMVELSQYKKLPHLMHPVVTDMKKAEAILAWAVDKMEERYSMLARAGVRHLSIYNQLSEQELRERIQPENDEEWAQVPKLLPFIVIVADELADLMLTAGKEVEQHIIRLAQKSRAVGIHLILATQKPTVDVITGLIKSNLPARIAFQVASRTDSRVVLDEMGADKLLGNGDMLFLSPGTSTLLRGQGTYLSDDEITRVVDFVSTEEQKFAAELVQLKTKEEQEEAGLGKLKNRDELYESAVDVVVRERRGSVSLLQRTLGIGYGRAARLIDYMADDGIVGEYNGSQAREVLLSIDEWEAMNGEEPSPEPPKPKRTNRILLDPDESDADGQWSDQGDPSAASADRRAESATGVMSEFATATGVLELDGHEQIEPQQAEGEPLFVAEDPEEEAPGEEWAENDTGKMFDEEPEDLAEEDPDYDEEEGSAADADDSDGSDSDEDEEYEDEEGVDEGEDEDEECEESGEDGAPWDEEDAEEGEWEYEEDGEEDEGEYEESEEEEDDTAEDDDSASADDGINEAPTYPIRKRA